ncbi:MAG: pilus assembly PilX N-terminal domain-containing protein [Acidobacteriota bacterium]|jgi:hypothetical protein
MTNRRTQVATNERGFALVLAILSLMLLTFLGLTLATTTSTELQIATNYRWSQQALYNAEAGLEAARIVLSNVADVSTGWFDQLPTQRVDGGGSPVWWDEGTGTGPWTAPAGPPPTGDPVTGRDFDMNGCDTRGGVGYGRVLEDTSTSTRYEDVSTFEGQTLNGAFTIWVRRGLEVDNAGQFADSDRNDALIIVSEGRAPYQGATTTFTAARQAVRVLETTFSLGLDTVGSPCLGTQAGQEGMSPTGENFNPCAPITAGAGGSLEGAFGAAGTGDTGALTSTGVE